MGGNQVTSERREMPDQMEIDKFCEWFEGEFDNWTQAASNPTEWAHIYVKHERIEDQVSNHQDITILHKTTEQI